MSGVKGRSGRPKIVRPPKQCSHCGKSFHPSHREYHKIKYCSRSCVTRAVVLARGQRLRPLIVKKCAACGCEFESKLKTQKLCGRACIGKLQSYTPQQKLAAIRARYTRGVRGLVCTCKQCGREYKPKALDRTTYCGKPCYYAYKAAHKKTTPESPVTQVHVCEYCGAEYHPLLHRQRLCRACVGSVSAKKEMARRYHAEHYKPVEATLTCVVCDSQYERPKRKGPSATCSDICAHVLYRKARNAQRSKRRSRKRGSFTELVKPEIVFAMDKGKCHLCGKAVKSSAKVPHPLAATLDHVVPIARGGDHSYRNVRLAHFQCNSLKGARAIGQARLLA